jgi:hypothetical protein
MWFIQILIGILLGWYLNPFKNGFAFRDKTNEIVGKLFGALLSLFDKNQEDEEFEYEDEVVEVKKPKQDDGKTRISISKPSKTGQACPSCGEPLEPMDGLMKGYLGCEKCNKVVTPIKAGAR